MTPANERKAAERQRRKDAGLVRVEVWVKPEHRAAIIALADDLNSPPIVTPETTVAIRRNANKAADAQSRALAEWRAKQQNVQKVVDALGPHLGVALDRILTEESP
jgi:hypothetical protein